MASISAPQSRYCARFLIALCRELSHDLVAVLRRSAPGHRAGRRRHRLDRSRSSLVFSDCPSDVSVFIRSAQPGGSVLLSCAALLLRRLVTLGFERLAARAAQPAASSMSAIGGGRQLCFQAADALAQDMGVAFQARVSARPGPLQLMRLAVELGLAASAARRWRSDSRALSAIGRNRLQWSRFGRAFPDSPLIF